MVLVLILCTLFMVLKILLWEGLYSFTTLTKESMEQNYLNIIKDQVLSD